MGVKVKLYQNRKQNLGSRGIFHPLLKLTFRTTLTTIDWLVWLLNISPFPPAVIEDHCKLLLTSLTAYSWPLPSPYEADKKYRWDSRIWNPFVSVPYWSLRPQRMCIVCFQFQEHAQTYHIKMKFKRSAVIDSIMHSRDYLPWHPH